MTKKTYWQKLKDPRWQKKRLEVMERADFTCEWCDATDVTLHVHHTYYRKGADPWDYEEDELLCLCQDCHSLATESLNEITHLMGVVGRSSANLYQLVGYLRAFAANTRYEDDHPIPPIPFSDISIVDGVADFFQISNSLAESYFFARHKQGMPGGDYHELSEIARRLREHRRHREPRTVNGLQ